MSHFNLVVWLLPLLGLFVFFVCGLVVALVIIKRKKKARGFDVLPDQESVADSIQKVS